jgi:hypothetical protein
MAGDWHHVRHQKKIKGTGRKKIITTYTAKQIPVCKVHHTLIHNILCLAERHVPGKPRSRGCGLALRWFICLFELVFNFTRFWNC